MPAIGYTSFLGSPGVTTWTALVANGVDNILKEQEGMDSLLLELDPAGSKMSLLSKLGDSSYINYAADTSTNPNWRDHAYQVPGGGKVISLCGMPEVCNNVMANSSEKVFELLANEISTIASIDLGRLNFHSPVISSIPKLNKLIVFIDRTNSNIVLSTLNLKAHFDLDIETEIGWAVIGKTGRGQSNDAIVRYSGIPVVLEIPNDPNGAAALFDQPSRWTLQRSSLAKQAYKYAKELVREFSQLTEVAAA